MNMLPSLIKKLTGYPKRSSDLNLLRGSDLFDANWYLANNPDVSKTKADPLLHYYRYGGFEGRDPGPKFSSSWYLSSYEDVKKAGINPLIHYLKYGQKEGRAAQPNIRTNTILKNTKSYPKLLQDKLDLIDFTFTSLKARSFADLGGVWGVEGGYTFYSLDKYDLTSAVMVDTHPTHYFKEESRQYTQLRFIQGDFGDEHSVRRVGQVDAIFLFDVLLHQVAPDWTRILEMYAPQVRCLIIYNQQWIGSNHTVRLLDLGEEEYFQNVPHSPSEKTYDMLFQKLDQKHPDHDKPWRDVHHIWQWGITDLDLQNKVESLGFRMQFYKNCGQVGNLKNFENHAFVFSK
jgi:hypothetical protein